MIELHSKNAFSGSNRLRKGKSRLILPSNGTKMDNVFCMGLCNLRELAKLGQRSAPPRCLWKICELHNPRKIGEMGIIFVSADLNLSALSLSLNFIMLHHAIRKFGMVS